MLTDGSRHIAQNTCSQGTSKIQTRPTRGNFGLAMARHSTPETLASVVAWTYGFAIQYGVLRADHSAVRAIEEAVQTAEGSSNVVALSLAEYTLGVALLDRDAAADRHRGLEVMVQARDIWLRERAFFMIPVNDLFAAQERARY